MNELRATYRTYLLVDNFLADKENRARSKSSRDMWSQRRALNDQAHFGLLFAKLEARINRLCSMLIVRKQKLSRWRQRRWWSSIEIKKLDRIWFLNRADMLLDRSSHHRANLEALYEIRCKIVHGGTLATPINVPTMAQTIFAIAAQLRK